MFRGVAAKRAASPSITSNDSDSELSDVPQRSTLHSSSDKENVTYYKGAKVSRGSGTARRNIGLQEASMNPSQALHKQVLEEEGNRDVYDPDQPAEERRMVRKDYRTLQRKLDDSKSEYLQPENPGLLNTILRAEDLFKNVKQTSDATLDSRLLVSTTDLVLKKITNVSFGGTGVSIDVDEFVGKCISFMRNANRPARAWADGESEDEDDTDVLDWAYLGRSAAFSAMKRPAPSDFMLGPLAVQKKMRVQKTRSQGLGHRKGEKATHPVEIRQDDIQQSENNTLKLVHKVYEVLVDYFRTYEPEEGVNLYKIVVNPESFSQTVENIFYVSFLVKEGKVAVSIDEDDKDALPMLDLAEPADATQYAQGTKRNQMIYSINMWEWKQAIEVFDIIQSIIPMRKKDNIQINANGWYN